MAKITVSRHFVGQQIRELRQERRWTQQQLAKLLGISQNYLSELERGQGSFTAEQLLTILKHFNIPIDYFSPTKSTVGDQLQNVLARQGANHLLESTDIIPSQQLSQVADAIREALVAAESARQVTAVAPILVNHAGHINFNRLRAEFDKLGLENRLAWAIENTLEAIQLESSDALPRELHLRYRRASIIIEAFFETWRILRGSSLDPRIPPTEDVLDPDITSKETLQQVKENRSPISKRWHVVTSIEVDDFRKALRAASDLD